MVPGATRKETASVPLIAPFLRSRNIFVRARASIISCKYLKSGVLQAHPLPEILGLPPAELDLGATLQVHQEPAAEPGLDSLDPGNIDDLAAVRPEEELGVQALLHGIERAEKLGLRVAEMNPGVVALAFQEADLPHLDEPAFLALAHKNLVGCVEAAGRRPLGGGRLQESREP